MNLDARLITQLRTAVEDTLRSLLAASTRVALLDFPAYSNVGDSAIWLGERAVLRALGRRVVYAADIETFDPTALRRRLGDGTILLSGGGNVGDLWPRHQQFRERLLREFPDHPIVQLPQSVRFDDPSALARARAAFDGHPAFVLLVRERQSLEVAGDAFRCTTRLCPDAAFGLRLTGGDGRPTVGTAWVMRTDQEARWGGAPLPGADVTDWVDERQTAVVRAERWLRCRIAARAGGQWMARRVLSTLQDRLARARVQRGCRTLARGRRVVTDRLHGHVLCLLLGIPHVVLDNSYGKVRSFFDTWCRDSQLARWAETPADVAREI